MTDSNFNAAVAHVLEREGGYVNHRNDPGGATNYGVSLRFLRSQVEIHGGLELFDFDGDGDVDADDIAHMTEQDARDIYWRFWWDKFGYKHINSLELATKVFDTAVNMGGKQAHKLVQRACRADGRILVDDGILGPKSFKAINSCNSMIVLGAARTEQKHFYLGLIDKNPDFEDFRDGWLNRAYL